MTTALVSLSIVSSFAQSTKQWTLEECIDYALANNISLKKKALDKQTAHENTLQAKAQLLPSVNASTTQGMGFRPWPNESMGMVSNGTVQRSVDKLSYNGTYGVNANWTVWNGNKNTNTLKLSRCRLCHNGKDNRRADNTALRTDSLYQRGPDSKQTII